MKTRHIIIAGMVLLLATVGYNFRAMTPDLLMLIDTKLTQRALAASLENQHLVNECMAVMSGHTGESLLIQPSDELYLSLPKDIIKHSPNFCLISSNHISFAWQNGPYGFWSLEIPSRNLSRTNTFEELLEDNPIARKLEAKVIRRSSDWIMMESKE